MLKKTLSALSLLVVLGLVLAGCANISAAGKSKVSLGQEFTLPVGQSATVSGEDLAVKFEAVTTDSRCPRGVYCIWAGEARCELKVCYKGETSTVTLKEMGGTDGFTQTTFKDLKISFKLTPYPEAGHHPEPGEYKLVMSIVKA